MKYPVWLILNTFIATAELNEVDHYGPRIKNVHDKYGSVGVIITLAANHLVLEKNTIWHETTRMLSDEGISTLVVNLRQFEKEMKISIGRAYRPLIVIVLDTIGELNSFEAIIKDLDMRYGVWLILFRRNAGEDVCQCCRDPHGNLLHLKFNSKVLISCCDLNMIEEWWSTEKNRTKRQEIGRLTNENVGIVWSSHKSIHDRRHSMDGREFRIAAIKLSNRFQEENGNYYGFIGEIIKELSQAMNFTISEIIWEDGYGVSDPKTASWTGVIGRIHRHEADIGVPDFSMTSERYNIVSFTFPIAVGAFQLHFRKLDAAHLQWNAYLKVLTVNVWMVIIGLILTIPILLTLIEYDIRKSSFLPLLFKNYSYIWGIYCQQSLPDFPKETPRRIVYVSIFISALVTLNAYSSAMISSLATFSSYSPFTTMEQFANDGTYGFIVVKDTAEYDMYKFSNSTIMKKMMSLMKPMDSLPLNYQEGFEQVCNDNVGLYMDETTAKSLLNSIPCEITSIRTGGIDTRAMIMPPDSEYVDAFNHHIQQLRYGGILRRLEEKYYIKLEPNKLGHQPVHLQRVAPVIFVLTIGAMIALIIFLMEKISYSSMKKLDNSKKWAIKRNAMRFNFSRTAINKRKKNTMKIPRSCPP